MAPWEFSSSSTSIFKAMVSADGRCLLRLERNAKEMFDWWKKLFRVSKITYFIQHSCKVFVFLVKFMKS